MVSTLTCLRFACPGPTADQCVGHPSAGTGRPKRNHTQHVLETCKFTPHTAMRLHMQQITAGVVDAKATVIQPNTTHACTSYITALTALPSMTWWRMRLVAARWLSPARRVVAGPVHFDKFSYVLEVRTCVNAEGRSSRNGSRKKYRRFWPLCSCLCVSTSSLLLRCKSLSVSFRTTVHRGQHSAHATCDSAWRHYGL